MNEWVFIFSGIAGFFAWIVVWGVLSGSFALGVLIGAVTFGIGVGVAKLIAVMPPLEALALGTVFVAGGLGFWLLLAATAIAVFWLMDREYTVSAAFSILSTLFLLQFLGDIRVFSHMVAYPVLIPVYLASYAGLGVIWSLVRWYLFVGVEQAEKIQEFTEAFLLSKEVSGTAVPDHLKHEWYFFVREGGSRYFYENLKFPFLNSRGIRGTNAIPANLEDEFREYVKQVYENIQDPRLTPRWREHKNKLALWILHWPWSILWYVLDDPIKRFLRLVYRHLSRSYEEIAQYAFRDINRNLPSVHKAKEQSSTSFLDQRS